MKSEELIKQKLLEPDQDSFAFQLSELIYPAAVEVVGKRAVKRETIKWEHPANMEHGDYASNLAMQIESDKFKTPWDLANKIVNVWRTLGLPDFIAKIEVVKSGFINVWLKNDVLVNQMEKVIKEGDQYGRTDLGKKRVVLFEYSHPNTHKLFHIGHLRTTLLGESLARIYEALGFKVVRTNYQGDVGLHIAKALWGLKKIKLTRSKDIMARAECLNKAYLKGNERYDRDNQTQIEIKDYNFLVYQAGQRFQKRKLKGVKLTKYLKLVQNKEIDPEAVFELWKKTRQWSLDYFGQVYQRLGVKFDRFYFESEVADKGRDIVMQYLKKGVFEKSQGAIIFPGQKHGLHDRVFLNQAGLPTYEAKDMALGRLQFAEFNPRLCLHVVGPEQRSYFQVVFKALAKIYPGSKGRKGHLWYGWVRLKEGKMASRKGEVIEINWLLDKVKKEIEKILKKEKTLSKKEKEAVAEAVAVGATKYWVLKFGLPSEITFAVRESVNTEGDSAPYLQYTFARCQSVLNRAEKVEITEEVKPQSEEAKSLLRILYRFPEVVREAGENWAPNLICRYLFDLAQKYNLFYHQQPILKAESQALVNFRLALTQAAAQILENGLSLLGIEAPERM